MNPAPSKNSKYFKKVGDLKVLNKKEGAG